jgi:hypothetical protein
MQLMAGSLLDSLLELAATFNPAKRAPFSISAGLFDLLTKTAF